MCGPKVKDPLISRAGQVIINTTTNDNNNNDDDDDNKGE